MKTSEHLAFLQRIATGVNTVRNTSDVTKGLLDHIIFFCKIDDALVYEDLLRSENIPLLLSEYKEMISEIKKKFNDSQSLIQEFSVTVFFEQLLLPYDYKIEVESKRLESYRNEDSLLQCQLESWSMKYSEESVEMKNLTRDFEIANSEYNFQKQKLEIVQKERDEFFENNSNILYFSFSPFLEKMDIIEKWILRLSNSNTFSQIIFKDEDSIELAYSILIKMSLLKTVSLPEFYNQITLSKVLSLEKNPSKDKYIAYSINKLKAFIVDNKKEIWEKTIVEYFQIQNFDKIKTVNQDHLKTKDHEEIDLKISNYFESLKS
ncbi:hypothetical protein [Kaistella sp.]|uniref:hypothetical protein n=1 Tax=Kaistella sp. TaxID=2782235 RepID=UPI00359FFC4C